MKNNKFLIIGSVLIVIALLTVQAYFIYNTYQLKEKEIKFEVKSTLEKLDDKQDFKNRNLKDDLEQQILIDFQNNVLNENQLILKLQNLEKVHAKTALNFIEKKFKTTNYQIGYSKNISSIVMVNNGVKKVLINKNIELFRSKTPLTNKLLLSTSSWHTSSEKSSDVDGIITEVNKKYEYEVSKVYNYSINNLRNLVLSQMIGLLIFSFLIMILLISMLFYMIKNIQKLDNIASMQRDFINNITHEFKTPMATLSIATKTLKSDFIDETILQNSIAIIERQNIRLQKIFDQVDFNSILKNVENTKIDQNINAEFIDNCINDFKISNTNVAIISNIDKNINVKISKFHCITILQNLLENVGKYGGTKLEINAKTENNSFVLKVKDNGIGIAKNNQNSIFEKFYRANSGDIHNVKGLGLGLFYTKEIVEKYNGKIAVESFGQGAEFIISIPNQ